MFLSLDVKKFSDKCIFIICSIYLCLARCNFMARYILISFQQHFRDQVNAYISRI